MDVLVYVSLRVVHVAVSAAWLGVTLTSSGGVKRALGRGVPEAREAVRMAHRNVAIAGIMGPLTLVTGLIIIFHMGGFGSVGGNIHTALTLVVIMLGVSYGLLRPAVLNLRKVVEAGDFAPSDGRADTYIKRLGMFGGIQQLFWLVVLALMFWRF